MFGIRAYLRGLVHLDRVGAARHAGFARYLSRSRQTPANRNNHPARHTVAVGVLPDPGPGEHLLSRGQDLCRIRPGQDISPHLDRLRPLGVLPEGDAGHPENAGLLLDPAGVGQDEAGVGLELEEFKEPDGVHDRDPVERDAELLDHLPGPGVHREDDGE